jgi:pyrimidine operon attenuation protein/uracil phosphoribosyltransferase
VADAAALARALRRLAHEIVERAGGTADLALVGVRTRGVFLAERLRRLIHAAEGVKVPLGIVDITLYRDDALEGLPRPVVGTTELPFPVQGRTLVIVDDVLYTGRTVRAALDAVMEFGRPRAVRLAVLVDRGGRELPVQADHVGLRVATRPGERVRVRLREHDGEERVVIEGAEKA